MTKLETPITKDFPPGFETTSNPQVMKTTFALIKARTGATADITSAGLSSSPHLDLTKDKSTPQPLAAYLTEKTRLQKI